MDTLKNTQLSREETSRRSSALFVMLVEDFHVYCSLTFGLQINDSPIWQCRQQ